MFRVLRRSVGDTVRSGGGGDGGDLVVVSQSGGLVQGNFFLMRVKFLSDRPIGR